VYRIIFDFDGTITPRDTGNELVRRFGAFEPHHTDLVQGRCTVIEYYRRVAASFGADATPDAITAWTASIDVDASFRKLVAWCEAQTFSVTVVSDGFDVYITPILARIGMSHLPVRCNELVHHNGTWTVHAPGATESCSCFCASCKRNAILASAADDDILVYVGDGMSDACAAEHADVVFAKGTLAAYCTAHGIVHHHFHTLHDVYHILRTRLEAGKIKPRKQARLARLRAVSYE
jgi:2,3-diketo-5-methylthio-1-phosphopentane phosphatase